MHELSLATALIESAAQHLPAGTRATLLEVELGALEHVEESAFELAVEAVAEGTAFEGAVLRLVRIPLVIRCRACANEYEPEDTFAFPCPACEAVQPEVLSGHGLVLRAIEAE
jgi:hydrogenase nickel incorporation protein HypA/HybF